MKKVGLYIDLDNMLGYCYSLGYEFDPSAISAYFEWNDDNIVVAKAYGNISTALKHMEGFPYNEDYILKSLKGIGAKYFPSLGRKNSSDLSLSLDAMEDLSKYDTLCVLSSDADFVPLIDKAKQSDKEVILVRMFKSKSSNPSIKEIYYPELLGVFLPEEEDEKIILYRNILESIMKMPLPIKTRVKEIADETVKVFTPGVNLANLADSVPKKDAFKILRTMFFGRGFVTDKENKYELLGIRGFPENEHLENAFYRQCFFILKKNVNNVDMRAFRRTFGFNPNMNFPRHPFFK